MQWGIIALLSMCGTLAIPATAAVAGPVVDSSGFTPEPPQGAECREHGTSVLCRTRFSFIEDATPAFETPCGWIYENSVMPRDIYTEYVDGLLVGRHVTSRVSGTWSLSPTGSDPTVRIIGGWNWRTELAVPGDESTAMITTHGNQLKISHGLSRYANISGIFYPNEEYHGVLILSIFDSAEAQEALCDVLTG
ncbi:hypothetical protein ASF21_10785 [Arthrobacter sp. Leaf234]|uniref:hypothetical protein n=1 Tax=Arthrobacter sp. Leaf234 TaxID=1736303 RepID=UPI0006F439E2|nr:hypothetical protein [Arthrobacter sp. Leaf234]KQO00797.1 hypothetical protein ASF21_10785 [Arthrobacter sp. Leaf234]